VAEQWLAHAAAADVRAGRSRSGTCRTRDGRRYTRTRWFTSRGRKVLEFWLVDGLGHAWSRGRAGGSFSDPAGPRAATLIWDFCRTQRLEQTHPKITVTGT
jgi:poly(3-hydroxybutyrate) depolymerase